MATLAQGMMRRMSLGRVLSVARGPALAVYASHRPALPHALAAACQGQRFMAASNTKPFTPLQASIDAVKKGSGRNFVESVEVAIRLNIDPRKADQALRGLAVLPHGIGKTMRIAVFATGPAADAALKAGASVVGADDLVEKIKEGFLDFDRAVATPSCMKFASKVARVLGPRGLMPNPKLGTVTDDVEAIIQRLNSGVPFKADKEGNIHACIGKVDFEADKIEANLVALVRALYDVKPKAVGGQYVLDVFVAASMGPSYRIELPDLNAKLGTASAASAAQASAPGPVKTKVKRGIEPSEWASVDLSTVASKKLKRYLAARRLAAGTASPA